MKVKLWIYSFSDTHRVYNFHFHIFQLNLAIPISQLFVTIFVEALAIYSRPRKLGMAILIMAAGLPVYWVGVCWKNKPRVVRRISGKPTKN